jgi:hypothetical protein
MSHDDGGKPARMNAKDRRFALRACKNRQPAVNLSRAHDDVFGLWPEWM